MNNMPVERDNPQEPWKPGTDVLGKDRKFRSVEDLIYVIQPMRMAQKGHYSTLQPTSRSVSITTQAIEKMMEE